MRSICYKPHPHPPALSLFVLQLLWCLFLSLSHGARQYFRTKLELFYDVDYKIFFQILIQMVGSLLNKLLGLVLVLLGKKGER